MGENLYAYTDGNPISRLDPSGLNWFYDRFTDIGRGIEWTNDLTGGITGGAIDRADSAAAGFADTITFGGTTKLREEIYGDVATRAHQGTWFVGGQIAGAAVGLAIGFGAGVGAARAGVWGARLARGYAIAGDVVAVSQSSYNLATGQATGWDALGFLPTVGWGLGGIGRLRGVASAAPRTVGGNVLAVVADDFFDPSVSQIAQRLAASRNQHFLSSTSQLVLHNNDSVLTIVAHGNRQGVRIGGTTLGPSEIAQLARTSRADVVELIACDSGCSSLLRLQPSLAQRVANQLDDVIVVGAKGKVTKSSVQAGAPQVWQNGILMPIREGWVRARTWNILKQLQLQRPRRA